MGEIWGYHVDGLFKTDKEAAEYQAKINDKAVNGRVYSSKVDGYLRAGDVRFADLNGDNVIGAGAGTVDDPGDKRMGIICFMERFVQSSQQAFPIWDTSYLGRLPAHNHQIQQPGQTDFRPLCRKENGRNLGIPCRRIV